MGILDPKPISAAAIADQVANPASVIGSQISAAYATRDLAVDPDAVGYDLIAGLGQSEMVGTDTAHDVARIDFTNPRVSQFAYTGTYANKIALASDPLGHQGSAVGLGPLTRFARNYVASVPANRSALLVPAARSGTGFSADSEGTWMTSGGSLLNNAIAHMNAAHAAAGANARWGAILWWQGQHDSDDSYTQAQYAGYFDAMIARIKAEVAGMEADTPVVVMQMNAEFRRGDYAPVSAAGAAVINSAHIDTPKRLLNSGFAYGPGLGYGMGDGLHTNAAGTRIAADAAFRAYRQAVYNVTGEDPQVPGAPTLTQSGTSLVAFTERPLSRFTDIHFQYRLVGAQSWTTLSRAVSVDASATITGLTLGGSYEVQAQTENEQGLSPWSATGAATLVTLPAQVTGLTAGTATGGSQPLTWSSVTGATGYEVDYKAASSGTWLTFGTVTATAATVTGLVALTSYNYRVRAVNAAGVGANSATLTNTTGEQGATFGDNFNRANGALGTSSIGAAPWLSYGTATHGIVSNVLKVTGGTAYATSALDVGATNGHVHAVLKNVSGSASTMISALAFRVNSEQDMLMAALRSSSTVAQYTLSARVAGVVTTLATAVNVPAVNDVLDVHYTGADVIVKVNGTTIITHTLTGTLTTFTKVGFYGHSSDQITQWDDFEYTPAA